MHGPGECTGDMQQLCARAVSASNTSTAWLNFADCQSTDQSNIPDNAAVRRGVCG